MISIKIADDLTYKYNHLYPLSEVLSFFIKMFIWMMWLLLTIKILLWI